MTNNDIIKIKCVSCSGETNHKKEWEKQVNWSDEESGIWWNTIYQAFSCQGCNEVTFRSVSTNSEDITDIDQNTGDPLGFIEHINLYPKRNSRMIKEKIDIFNTPLKIRQIYQETIAAYNNEQLILCAIGIRAIIEAICLAEDITIKGLDNKIKELIKRGIVTSKLGQGLQENRLLGNQSAHELEIFGDRELLPAIQLIENIIDGHYSAQEKIDLVSWRRRMRKQK